MKKLIAILLLGSMFILPVLVSCVPNGYEEGNPARPEDNQVDVESLPPNDNADDSATTPDDSGE